MGARRQRFLLRRGQASVCDGCRRSYSRRKQPSRVTTERVSTLLPAEYGLRELPRGLLFSPEAQPIRRLVIHDDFRREWGVHWYFVNPLAYDIARKIGAIAPETKPVRFFVNGEYYGPFVLTERFDERFFAAHFGYDDVLLSQDEMNKLWDWVLDTRPLTMKTLSEHVNIDNLTRWFLAVAVLCDERCISGTRTVSGPDERDRRLVLGELGHGPEFPELESRQLSVPARTRWRRATRQKPGRTACVDPDTADCRGSGISRILQARGSEALNHHVTDAFLQERYEHYLDTATQLRVPSLDYLPRFRQFFDRRRAFFRLTTEQWLNSSPSQPVTVSAPENVALIIDGERVSNGYQGMYFPDLELIVDVRG